MSPTLSMGGNLYLSPSPLPAETETGVSGVGRGRGKCHKESLFPIPGESRGHDGGHGEITESRAVAFGRRNGLRRTFVPMLSTG